MNIPLLEYAWSDSPREVDYYLPDSWDITVYHITGHQRPVLTPEQVRGAIASPISSQRINDLARGKKKVCIIFDDMTRGTPVSEIVPHIIAELKEGGIADSQIELICALGSHQALDRVSLARKLGEDIIARYPVFNHSPFTNCTYLGKTSFGTKVEVNTEVMSCDLKIAISAVTPHTSYGFGGGGKIIMPGVSSFASMSEHHGVSHRDFCSTLHKTPDSKGVFEGNPLPLDAMEFARIVDIDFSINCLINEKSQIVEMHAGDIQESFKRAVASAKKHYQVPDMRFNDIVIANSFYKENEAFIAMDSASIAVKRTGGTVVVIANSPLGQVVHYLYGSWGLSIGGKQKIAIPSWVDHFIFYSEFPDARNVTFWDNKDLRRIAFPSKWGDVIKSLVDCHGSNAKVAVFPDATIQYAKQKEYEK